MDNLVFFFELSVFLKLFLIESIIMGCLANLLQQFKPLDSHFHYFSCLEKQIVADEQLKFAFENGLFAAIDAGTTTYPFEERKLLAESYSHLFLLAGYHPENCHNEQSLDLKALKENLCYTKTVALGEVGLDYACSIPRKMQQKTFALQLELTKQIHKPVVLHVRDTHEDAISIIREHQITNGIIHCFTGNKNEAKQWLDQGFYLSFSGIVTFKSATVVQESALYTPLEHLFCETDAPFLAPTPHRGHPNQVGFVAYVYQYIANLKNVSPQVLSSTLIANFRRFINKES